jgi:hypothetical protein
MFDLHMGLRRLRQCDGASRRDFLRVGGLATLGLSLPSLLRAQAAAAAETEASDVKARAKSVLLVFLGGGISHIDSFDPKPDTASEIRGKYGVTNTSVPGLIISDTLPLMSRQMHRLALLRSCTHNLDVHEGATNWVMSGRSGSIFGDHPAIGAVVAHETGFAGKIPPYVAIPKNPSFTWELGKAAYLGVKYESFKTGDPNEPNFRVRDVTVGEPMSQARTDRRRTLLKAVDGLAAQAEHDDQLAAYDQFQQKAADMILSPDAREAFALDKESAELKDKYGHTTFGQSALLGRRLIEHGVKFATVFHGGWDHHKNIFEGLDKKLPELDRVLSTLIEDMTQRGLLDETLLVVMTEFGRSPKVNKDAGRDHWVPVGNALFAGAGVQGGRVVGASDKIGGAVADRPAPPADVAYTILSALGINPRKHLYTPDGRPMEILDQGAMIRELFV